MAGKAFLLKYLPFINIFFTMSSEPSPSLLINITVINCDLCFGWWLQDFEILRQLLCSHVLWVPLPFYCATVFSISCPCLLCSFTVYKWKAIAPSELEHKKYKKSQFMIITSYDKLQVCIRTLKIFLCFTASYINSGNVYYVILGSCTLFNF